MIAKRLCKIVDGRTPGAALQHPVESATLAELLGELQTLTGRSYVGQSASVLATGETDVKSVSGNDILPTGEFRIYFMPEKQKSGN